MAGAVVIGAGPGIGRAVAVRLAREGLAVAVMARTKESVEAAARAVAAAGGKALPLVADATDEVASRAALDAAEAALGPRTWWSTTRR
ncbi:hypothetical protein Phou_003460 [Phytohabitans houttuyneae]|uniref:Short-chain dehydrogenase n=1 Tax=Phytohabitans houttuyneae TaxID=1076126 RepID=A0A6V8K2H8_9ACTN|nr:hypothetical protein Phou_003460 [Phytohabitans houttuyneae]